MNIFDWYVPHTEALKARASMTMTAIRYAVLSVLICLPMSASAAEAEELPVLNVCGFDWAPYSYKKDGQTIGILIDLLNLVDLPYDVHFNIMPLPRCSAAVRLGQEDLILYNSTPHDKLIMSEAVVQYHISGIVVPTGSEHKTYAALSQFTGETLGVLRGNPIYDSVRQYRDIHWALQNSGGSMWKMLLGGRLEGAIGEYLSLTRLQAYHRNEIRFLRPPLRVTTVYMAVHQSKAAILPLINRRFTQLLRDGSVDRIYEQHGVVPFSAVKAMADNFERD